ncbi:MAG: hypothetical protein H6766_00105 [Candidatus Peribacteria bacterium]|nr:MAG: hypothetical protein H6766_00105 [Candidatus Peribacteria bacterium]
MYFYIIDDPDNKDAIYAQVIALQDELQAAGLETSFKDKDAALSTLFGNNNRDLIKKFDEYGIGNPLPATLNVIFENEEELISLKKILIDYRDIITNITDVRNPTTFKEQEQRNLTAINLGYLVMGTSSVIIAVLLVGIITFLLYMLKSKFANFHKTIQIKKLLGAYYSQITGPFIITTSLLLVGGFVIMIILSSISIAILHHYLLQLLGIDLYASLHQYKSFVSSFLLLELAALIALGWALANLYTRRLIAKINH